MFDSLSKQMEKRLQRKIVPTAKMKLKLTGKQSHSEFWNVAAVYTYRNFSCFCLF